MDEPNLITEKLTKQQMFEFTYPTPLQAKPDLQGPQTGSIWAFKKF